MKTPVALALVFCLEASSVVAEEPRQIGLREALAVAVRQNPTLEIETIDVGIAQAQILAASGLDDFILDSTFGWLSSRTEPVAGQFIQQTALDNLSFSGGITRPLASGGTVGLRLGGAYSHSVSRVDYSGTTSDISTDTYAPSLALEFRHPFLKGYGKDIARADRRRAQAAKDVATLDRENTAAGIVRDVIHAYWELSYSVEEVSIRRSSLELAK